MEKRSHSGKTLLLGVLLILAAAAWGLFRLNSRGESGAAGSTNAQRVEYINSCGYQCSLTQTDVCDIRIPVQFDSAYEQYNEIQLKQGFDLRPYRACRVKKFTYTLTDYVDAGGGAPAVNMNVNLLVLDGEIVGADISSARADGLVTVLKNS